MASLAHMHPFESARQRSDREEQKICLSRAASADATATQIEEQIFALENQARQYRALAERMRGRAALLEAPALSSNTRSSNFPDPSVPTQEHQS